LKGHQEIHYPPRFGAAIEEIAGLNQNRGPAGPASAGIDEVRTLKNSDEGVEVAMNIAHSDDALSGGRRRESQPET